MCLGNIRAFVRWGFPEPLLCMRHSVFNFLKIGNVHVIKLRALIVAFPFLTGKMRRIQ